MPLPPEKPKMAALYARVSTARQEEEQTIESQISEVSTRIEEGGDILPRENIFTDDGWTGSVLERPGLEAMRDAAQSGKFQVLYVYDRGRLSRNFIHQEVLLEELQRAEIEFVSLHDINARTPEENILQSMQGLFHDYERVKIAERFRRGKQHKVNRGILIQGHALYGYRYNKKTDSGPATYEVDEGQARIVREIYEWVANEEISQREVIRRLYDLGIKPPKGKSDFWTKGPIARMLRDQTYVTGQLYYFKHEAIESKTSLSKYRKVKKNSRKARPKEEWKAYYTTQAIITKELFERVQKKLAYNQKYLHKQTKYDYLLSGLVYCECGNRRVGDGCNSTGHRYYRCIERVLKQPNQEVQCRLSGINAQVLDKTVWQELKVHLADPDLLYQQAKAWLEKQGQQTELNGHKIRQLIAEAAEVKDEEGRYVKAYGEGLIEFEQLVDLKKTTRAKILLIQSEIDKMSNKNQTSEISDVEIQALCQEAQNVLNSFESDNQKAVLHELIDKIIIFGSNRVEVHAHVPLPALKLGYGTQDRHRRATKRR
jgi:site-specific DNA recombinase